MRKRWIQIEGKLVPADEVTFNSEARKGPFVMGDIQPYKAITGDMEGKYITSRSQHREFLKRNNLVEVGNEQKYFTSNGGMSFDNPNLIPEHKQEERVAWSLKKNLEKLQSR